MPTRQDGSASADEKLAMAIIGGSVGKIVKALAQGASLDGALKHSSMPLLVAASTGRDRLIELLAEKGANLEGTAPPQDTNCKGPIIFRRGRRALHAALTAGVSTVRLLLRLGADPNAKDSDGNTPLYLACLGKIGLPCIQALLDRGADPAAMNNDGMAPVHAAAGDDSSDAMRLLLGKAPSAINLPGNYDLTPLGLAVTANKENVVRFLIAAGASDREVLLTKGISSLHDAVQGCHERLVRILINEGIEAVGGLASIAGALRTAVRKGQPRILHMLLTVQGERAQEYCAEQVVRYRSRFVPEARREPILHMAARYGSPAAVRVLMGAGAREDQPDDEGRSAADVIGSDLPAGDESRRRAQAECVRRTLARGPAWRARSWAWTTEPGARAIGGPLRKVLPVVRVYRPSSPNFFVRLFPRYAPK